MISNSGTTSLGLYDFKRQIDAFGGVDYFSPTLAGGYLPNARVMLANGEIVQNVTDGNLTNDPNVDMTGWVKVNSASQIIDKSGKDQQFLNTGLTTISQLSQILSPYEGMRIGVKSAVDPNYALAQPYIGSGEFIYTSAKSGVNDGGVVINGWVRIFDGSVKPEWWGADRTGATSSLSAIQSAIDYCRNNPLRPMGANRGGMGSIELDGFYTIDGELDLKGVNGLTIKAKSKYSTVILYTPNVGRMVHMERYLNVNFEDILFSCGTYNISTDKLITPYPEKNAVAFNLKGQDGGKQLSFTRCRFEGFKTAYRTMDDVINCDTLTALKCEFNGNDTVWENSNPNAVIWTFDQCSIIGYKRAFINPANTLRVVGGQAIGDTFWYGSSLNTALNCYLTFKAIRFESGINIDPTTQPKWLDISCYTVGTLFEDCPMYGLPSGGIASVVTGNINFIAPQGDIKFKNCQVRGIFEVVSNYAKNGTTSRLAFENCEYAPTVNQTYGVNSANKYINLTYINHHLDSFVRVNRTFLSMFNAGGVGGGVAMGSSTIPMIDVFSFFRVATSAGAYSREMPIWCVNPYKLNVSGFKFSYQKGVEVSSFNIAVYSDNTKAVKIAELLNVGAGKTHGVAEVYSSNFLSDKEITATSSPLFVEITNTESLGIINLDTHVHLMQQAHQF